MGLMRLVTVALAKPIFAKSDFLCRNDSRSVAIWDMKGRQTSHLSRLEIPIEWAHPKN